MKLGYEYGCGYDTIWVRGYVIFLKFRIRLRYVNKIFILKLICM